MRKILFLLAFFLLAAPAWGAESFYTPAQSLNDLKRGNLRFLAGRQLHPRQDKEQRLSSVPGQHPKAVVVACVDARVPVEVLFDQGIGDLFVLRVPGNTAGRDVQVGIWYAITKLRTPLVVVLGHTDCEAINSVSAGEGEELLPAIAKVVRDTREEAAEQKLSKYRFRQLLVTRNVENSLKEILEKQPGIIELIGSMSLRVIGAVYDLENGRVEWLEY